MGQGGIGAAWFSMATAYRPTGSGGDDVPKSKRAILHALWALSEEVTDKHVVRVEAKKKLHQDPQQRERKPETKPETFTLVCRHGESGNRVEKYVNGILHHVLTQAHAL